ncbi:MAG: polyprenyl synthetase family protein [Candidatus Nanopelagicales bacterium]
MVSTVTSVLDAEDLRARVNKLLDAFIERQRPILCAISDDLDIVVSAAAAILQGGKRLRPAFAYWGWRGAGAADCESIVAAVTSLELLQACALIHDDVMDGSATRRGQPSVHKRFARIHQQSSWLGSADGFGEGAAILMGDLALTWADELLFQSGLPDASLLRAKPTYDRMRTELMAGQYLDLLEQARGGGSVERAMRVARYKAAKYTVEGPLQLGGILAGASSSVLDSYSAYGLPLGEAFQLRDDLLGVFGDPAVTGKPAGDDLREGKRTVLIALAHQHATPEQRSLLQRHLGDPNLTSDGVDELREVLVTTGAYDHVERLIGTLAEQASQALRNIDEPAESVLAELALAATTRHG